MAYDSAIDTDVDNNRLSTKRFREQMARLDVGIEGNFLNLFLDGEEQPWLSLDERQDGPSCKVREFNELTPAIDAGDEAAELMAELLGVPSARVARKTEAWMEGLDGTNPTCRAVAPLHIVTLASIERLRNMGVGQNYDYRRFRPNIVVRGLGEPGQEQEWIGRYLSFGDTVVKITRPTIRCVVTGRDPDSGYNINDVPKLFEFMKPEDGSTDKPVMGVYGAAQVEPGSGSSISTKAPIGFVA